MSVNSMDPRDEGMVKLGFRTPLLVYGFNAGQLVPPHVRISHQCGKRNLFCLITLVQDMPTKMHGIA
jgi:hypothetical protein